MRVTRGHEEGLESGGEEQRLRRQTDEAQMQAFPVTLWIIWYRKEPLYASTNSPVKWGQRWPLNDWMVMRTQCFYTMKRAEESA